MIVFHIPKDNVTSFASYFYIFNNIYQGHQKILLFLDICVNELLFDLKNANAIYFDFILNKSQFFIWTK